MDALHIAGSASALLGGAGTLILFFYSFSLQPYEGAVWGGPEVDKENSNIRRKNSRRIFMQKIGLSLICASFAVQLYASIFL